MPRIRMNFANDRGESLAAALELPDGETTACALFAHCFSCSKDLHTATRVSRALAARGIAVLRFDFTGLGASEGDFANTSFSTNLEDLVAAARHLEATHGPPTLLIGHSLGGAAVLAAAHQLPAVCAVATIGAPATADHLTHLLRDAQAELLATGEARIEMGGRAFRLRRQFLEDIRRHNTTAHIGRLGRALLILHAPGDTVVPIEEAARIYMAARHPKSFVCLDGADHLLGRAPDAEYAGALIAAWASRYVGGAATRAAAGGQTDTIAPGEVRVRELNHAFTRSIQTTSHQLLADEPASAGGADRGPNPYELLLAALGACTSMTIRMYAERKGLALEDVRVHLAHDRIHAEDCHECETREGMVDRIVKRIHLAGELSPAERARLLEIAERCPVNRTLKSEISIVTRSE